MLSESSHFDRNLNNAEAKPVKPGSNDLLLQNFSQSQREYIIDQLYPELRKALIHFVAEATRCN